MDVWRDSVVSVVDTAFTGITVAPRSAAIYTNGTSRLRLQNCVMHDVSGLHLRVSDVDRERQGRRSVVYTDSTELVANGTWRTMVSHLQSVLPLSAGGAVPWLLPNDPRLVALREVRSLQGCASPLPRQARAMDCRARALQDADAAAAAARVEVVADAPGMSPLATAVPPAAVPPAQVSPPMSEEPTKGDGADEPTSGPVSVVDGAAPDPLASATSAGEDGSQDGSQGGERNMAAIAGGAAAAAVVVAALLALALLVVRHRRRRRGTPPHPDGGTSARGHRRDLEKKGALRPTCSDHGRCCIANAGTLCTRSLR